jgi:tetratricopeptide (TPR) repeat protein
VRRSVGGRAAAAGGARPRLTVCLIVRDEAENLRRALASVRAVADEVVVVDTGSSDESVAVARAFGARVGHFAWCDDFAAARNAALGLASGAWILSLDADEELEAAAVAPLRRLVAADPDGPTVGEIAVECLEDGGELERAMIPRLASNRPDVRFVRPIHEEFANVAGGQLRRFAAPEIMLRHYGYGRAERERQSKDDRNLRLLLRAVERWPGDVVYRYYLGLELVAQRRFAEAVAVLERWIDPIERALPRVAVVRAWVRYVTALEAIGRTGDAAGLAVAASERLGSASLHGVAAEALLSAGRPADALPHADAVDRLAVADAPEEVMPARMLRGVADLVRGHAARQLGDLAGARRSYERAVAASPGPARVSLADLLLSTGERVDAERLLREALALAPDDERVNVLLSQVERESERLQEPVDRLAELLARVPTSLPVRLELAQCLEAGGEHATAVDVLAAALEAPQLQSASGSFRAHYHERLGVGLLQLGRGREALDALEIALLADPSRPGPRAILDRLRGTLATPVRPEPAGSILTIRG